MKNLAGPEHCTGKIVICQYSGSGRAKNNTGIWMRTFSSLIHMPVPG